MREWWKHISDPALWPNERLFYELYGRALQDDALRSPFLDGIVEDWLAPATEINVAYGLPRELARAHARLGIAAVRGLLLDLLATGDVDGRRRVDGGVHRRVRGVARASSALTIAAVTSITVPYTPAT